MTPGSNLLALALGALGTTPAVWHPWVSRTQNALGRYVDAFGAPVPIIGSFQPLTAERVQLLGLDMARDWHSYYTGAGCAPVREGRGADLLDIAGSRYTIMHLADGDWQAVDGWRELIIVREGLTP